MAITPAGVVALSRLGATCRVETEAGFDAGYPDEAYAKAGADVIGDRQSLLRDADALLQVRTLAACPGAVAGELDDLKSGAVVVGMGDFLMNPAVVEEYARRGLTLFYLDLLPRISRAQSMDVLSSMATIAGYKAVLLAASESPQLFPLMMTAAGTLAPAKVLVIGAGVAGLQAIATARRLGAQVRAYDVRSAAREQIESVGASVVELDLLAEDADAEDADGYATQASEEQERHQRDALAQVVADCDVVITTAAIPGRRPPLLIMRQAIEAMRPGSIIVDLAAERGGNCELCRADESVVHNGVGVFGPTNLASSTPLHGSQMFSNNLVSFFSLLSKEGELVIDTNDEIIRDTLVTNDGEITNARLVEASSI